jgi:PAS domain S-box-containing protein
MGETTPRAKKRSRVSSGREASRLDRSSDAFVMLFERNPVPLLLYERASLRFVAVNGAALALYGFTRPAFLAMTIADILPEEDRQSLRQRMQQSEEGLLKVGVRRHVGADGQIVHVELLRQELMLDGREVALISARDLTKKLRAEEQLRQSLETLRGREALLARAERVSHTGSVERDLRSGAVQWSEEAYRLFGRPRDWVPPGSGHRPAVLALFHPDDRAKYAAVMEASEAGRPNVPIEIRVLRPDGTVRWVYHESEVLFDENGQPARRIGTYRDITEVHEAAEQQQRLREELSAAHRALQATNYELERRVEERTADLRAAQDELLKKERLSVMGQLTATVAHELRNPLSAIRNSLFALRAAVVPPESPAVRIVDRIERSIMRCNGIISDLLDFTRVAPPKQKRTRLDDWIGEVLDEQAVPAGIAIERRFGAGEAAVMIDFDRFRRVLINLVENAAQAIDLADAPLARRLITVETRVSDRAEIVIADTGPGMAPDILARVFEPLFSTKPFGTGLGLATVKQIVEQHGGAIALSSAQGQGTTVRITLPLAAASAAAA